MENQKEVVLAQATSPAEMIRDALQGGADLDNLEKLLELQERWEAREAKKAYHVAMANFKAVPLHIEKDKKVVYSISKGNIGYSHASLANVVKKITAGLSKHGLSASWSTQQNGSIAVTCRITHVMGHSEETALSAPSDTSGSKNHIQAIGSTISYLERYTILAALGLATSDIDDDGVSSIAKFITPEQVKFLNEGIEKHKIDIFSLLVFLDIEKLEDLLAADYNKAIAAIRSKKDKKEMG